MLSSSACAALSALRWYSFVLLHVASRAPCCASASSSASVRPSSEPPAPWTRSSSRSASRAAGGSAAHREGFGSDSPKAAAHVCRGHARPLRLSLCSACRSTRSSSTSCLARKTSFACRHIDATPPCVNRERSVFSGAMRCRTAANTCSASNCVTRATSATADAAAALVDQPATAANRGWAPNEVTPLPLLSRRRNASRAPAALTVPARALGGGGK